MIFKEIFGLCFLLLSLSTAETESFLADDIAPGIFEYSSNYADRSDPYASEEENYDIIFDEEETPGACSQILHRRLMQFLRNVRELNSTRQGRQDDEGGDDGDDGDGGDAAGAAAPVEVLGLELPAAVPQFFKVVANALVSNESAATIDMGFKALAPILQNQVTGAVSLFANVLQGGSPFASQGPQPTRPTAPIRQWPSNTRRPRPRPSQTPLKPNRPSYSEEEDSEYKENSKEREPSRNREPPREREPSRNREPPTREREPSSGERRPAAGVLTPPRRRRTTTFSPGRQSTSREETESDFESPNRPPEGPTPIIRAPNAGSLNKFYATTQKVEQKIEAESSVAAGTGTGGGSLKDFYSPKAQEAGDANSQSQIGSLNQFYSTTPKEHSAQVGSLNQFYSTTANVQDQESPQSELESPEAPSGISLNQFYAPKPNAPGSSNSIPESPPQIGSLNQFYAPKPVQQVQESSPSKVQLHVQESPQSEAQPPTQIGSLKHFYSTTARVQGQEDLQAEAEPQQGGSLSGMYSPTAKVQEAESEAAGQAFSLKQFYAGTSKVQENPASEVEVPKGSGGLGGSLKNFYSTVAPESNEEAESEIDTGTGFGGSLKQFYSSTPNVKVKVIVQPENSVPEESSPPVKQSGITAEQNEDQNHVQWGALRRFYSTSTEFPQVRFPDGEEGQEKFASALLGSLNQQIRRKPVAVASPVANSQNEVISQEKFVSLFNPNPPVTDAALPPPSSSPPKRRRRTTSTTESEYYDEETEKPGKKT